MNSVYPRAVSPVPDNSGQEGQAHFSSLTDAQLRLALVAERLFALRGIDGVSLREIAAAAGNGNNNAVQYHFGCKNGLLRAIFEHRVREMSPVRQRLLKTAQVRGSLLDSRALLEIPLLPLIEQVDESGRHSHAGFLLRYFTQLRTPGIADMNLSVGKLCPALSTVLKLTRERLSYLPPGLRESRIRRSQLLFFTSVVSYDNAAPEDRSISLELLVEDALESAIGCLFAPFRATQARLTPGSGSSDEPNNT